MTAGETAPAYAPKTNIPNYECPGCFYFFALRNSFALRCASMLCINLLALLLGWRRLGWSRNERLDAAMLLVMFALFPWLEYRVLPVGAFEGNLWAQVGCYCAGQAIGYVSVVLAPDWLGRLRQRRYEERVLSGREKFRSRKEVLEQRAEAQEAQRRAKELRRAKK